MSTLLKSIDVADFKYTLENYIYDHPLPLEIKRYVVKEVLDTLSIKSKEEMLAQAQEREAIKQNE